MAEQFQDPELVRKCVTLAPILVAVDIEACSRNAPVKICSVGLCVGDETGTIFQKKRINFDVDWFDLAKGEYGDFDKRVVDGFWSHMPPEMIEACKDSPIDHANGWIDIALWIDALETMYPGREIVFLSDNPSFDVAAIDFYLNKYCGRAPMRFSTTGTYRDVLCVDSMMNIMGTTIAGAIKTLATSVVPHDHNPANDAHHIMKMYSILRSRGRT